MKKVKVSNENDESLKVAICCYAFSFRHFRAVFQALFYHFFSLRKKKIKKALNTMIT